MSEPHIIVGSGVGPAGPTASQAGPFQTTAKPGGQAEITITTAAAPAADSVADAAATKPADAHSPHAEPKSTHADAKTRHAGEGARGKAGLGSEEARHRSRGHAKAQRAASQGDEPLLPPARSGSSADEDEDGDEGEAEEGTETETAGELKAKIRRAAGIPIRLGRGFFMLVWHGLRALGSFVWAMSVRYPRGALAAAASVIILGAIEYTQWRGANGPVINQISTKKGESNQAKTEAEQSGKDKTPASTPKPAGADTRQAKNGQAPSERPEPAPAAAPPQAASAGQETSPSSGSPAPADPTLLLAAPDGQTGLRADDKAVPAKTESAIVSAPGLLVAGSEPLPPPASSLGKNEATLLLSSAESGPPASSSSRGNAQTPTSAGQSGSGPAPPPDLAPAPAPALAHPDNGQDAGDPVKPAPAPAEKHPEDPVPKELEQPPPVAKPADSANPPEKGRDAGAAQPAPAGTPKEPGQPAAKELEQSPVVNPLDSANLAESGHGAGDSAKSSPAAAPKESEQHSPKGLEQAPPPVALPLDSLPAQATKGADDSPVRSPAPANPPAGSGPKIDAQAKHRSDDKPELGPVLISPPVGDASSEGQRAAEAPAAPSAGPHGVREGEVHQMPRPDHEPEPSPALPQSGEEPAKSQGKPSEASPLSNPESRHAPDAAAKLEPGGERTDDATGSPANRTERGRGSIAAAATASIPPGWVAIRNSGKVPLAAGEDPDPGPADAGDKGAGSAIIRDSGAHAARNVAFEFESPRSRATARDTGTNSTQGAPGQSGSTAAARRVETVPHVVERNENFWTISRQYYGSGRYYRALWKANADRCPQIDGLYVNDVIIIPPMEDLDPRYIDSPGEHARSSRGGSEAKSSGIPPARDRRRSAAADTAETAADASLPGAAESPPSRRGTTTGRTRQLANTGDDVPIQRSSRTGSELDLPKASSESIFARDRRSSAERREDSDAAEDDDEPRTRSARRPRPADPDSDPLPESRPFYKVRPNDTLRSIARDTLGNSRRAKEILDLNRDKIDDPDNLIVGQTLDLPDDARTALRRRASR